MDQRCIGQNLWKSRVARLNDNIVVLQSAFNNLAMQTISNITEAQREINREFTPLIAAAMGPTYVRCSQESGKLSSVRYVLRPGLQC